jgi:hypothetical protein
MNTTDFTKTKMHFTIGLMAALFALHPFFPQLDNVCFVYMGTTVPLSWALMAIGICLACAVYFYATDLMSEQTSALSQRLGNWFYSMAIMMVPFYLGLFVTTLLEAYLVENEVFDFNIHAPAITLGILAVWVFLWQSGTWVLRRYLTRKDWTSRVEQLTDREMDALKRAKELQEAGHSDLAIIQYHKAVLARLTMATMKQGYFDSRKILASASRCGIINTDNVGYVNLIMMQNTIASSTKPAEAGAVEKVAEATKRLLATVAV